jgi:dTMP kinase
MLTNLTTPHEYPGKLFVVEGIDGSGKTTQLSLLAKWLSAAGHPVFVTEWNSSALVKAATKSGKKKNALTPMTFSLLHATDFADRLLYHIIPPLKAGMIVLADRYTYTAFARDATRGVDRRWVRGLYSFAVKPDLAVYFRVPIEVSTDRLLGRRVKLKF